MDERSNPFEAVAWTTVAFGTIEALQVCPGALSLTRGQFSFFVLTLVDAIIGGLMVSTGWRLLKRGRVAQNGAIVCWGALLAHSALGLGALIPGITPGFRSFIDDESLLIRLGLSALAALTSPYALWTLRRRADPRMDAPTLLATFTLVGMMAAIGMDGMVFSILVR